MQQHRRMFCYLLRISTHENYTRYLAIAASYHAFTQQSRGQTKAYFSPLHLILYPFLASLLRSADMMG